MNFFNVLSGNQSLVLSLDTGIILFIFIAGFLYGLRVRKKRLILFIVSIYSSIALASLFPFLDAISAKVPTIAPQIIYAAVLVIFTLLTYYVLSGSILKVSLPVPKWKKDQFWQIVILSFALSGFLISVAVPLIIPFIDGRISLLTENLFLTGISRLIWLFAPLASIMLVAQYKKK